MYKKIMIIFSLALMPLNASSGELIRNAKILEVANTFGNTPDFALRLEDGIGVCSSTIWVRFPESKKQTDDSYDQSFSIALTAFSTGDKVRIHNYENDSCTGANFISISK